MVTMLYNLRVPIQGVRILVGENKKIRDLNCTKCSQETDDLFIVHLNLSNFLLVFAAWALDPVRQ